MDRAYMKSRWIVASTFLPCFSDFKWAKFTYISAAAGSITASSRVSMIRKRLLLQKRLFVVCIRTSIRLRPLKHTRADVKKCQIRVKRCREDVKTEGSGQKAVGSGGKVHPQIRRLETACCFLPSAYCVLLARAPYPQMTQITEPEKPLAFQTIRRLFIVCPKY